MNKLYFGDNLSVLREHIANESVDLIYLDPPFNSKSAYNILFKSPKGIESAAQITAFDDTWHWGTEAESEYTDLLRQSNTDVSELIRALRNVLSETDMMAYLVMMAGRLLELHRVLKSTGSLYLHCDSTASHYLKILLDAVFGGENFLNEIIWKRQSAHSDAKRFAKVSDTILFYSKSDKFLWNPQHSGYDEEYIRSHYNNTTADGRKFTYSDLTKPKGSVGYFYKLLECDPPPNGWRMPESRATQWLQDGRIEKTPTGKTPRYKRYLDEMPGSIVTNVWDDIPPVNSQGKDSLGYPTQKPVALLERIISASCPPDGVVLDPFCGCGTTIHAAQKLGMRWIGIDVTHLAITLIEKRMHDAFPEIKFDIEGTPKDLEGARNLAERDKYQFQWWACSLVNAQPYQGKKKGADSGIDGLIFFQDDIGEAKKIIVSVKGGENVGVTMVKDLRATMERDGAQIGIFVTLVEPTKPMVTEAVSTGFYESPNFPKVPRIQILTIEGLLNGTERPQYTDMGKGALTFKQAEQETAIAAEQLTLYTAPDKKKRGKK